MYRRNCLKCKTPIRGRSDKKFCTDGCRNRYNYKLSKNTNHFVRGINQKLRKNRIILTKINITGQTSVTKEILIERGYDFNYHTHIYTDLSGRIYYFCYEQGILYQEDNTYLILQSSKI